MSSQIVARPVDGGLVVLYQLAAQIQATLINIIFLFVHHIELQRQSIA